jgi:hypothetical protein
LSPFPRGKASFTVTATEQRTAAAGPLPVRGGRPPQSKSLITTVDGRISSSMRDGGLDQVQRRDLILQRPELFGG